MPRTIDDEIQDKPKKKRKKRHKKPGFVDYSVETNFKKLTKRQQFYVKEMAKHFRHDIRNMTRQDYKSLPTEIKRNVLKDVEKILSGEKYREMQGIAIDNYIKAMEFYGAEELSGMLSELNDALSENEKQQLMSELPALFLFYKDKVQLSEGEEKKSSHNKREKDIGSEDIEFQMSQAMDIISEWYATHVEKADTNEEKGR